MTRREHAFPDRYLLPRIPVRRLLMALGFVVTILGITSVR